MALSRSVLLVAALPLGACGPVSPERAADMCEERARAATGPTGEIGVGVGSDGAKGSLEIGVTSDYILGRDPYIVYETCVREKTGQGPIRPLELER
ncbi:MAG: hypothetical protein AAFR73_04855 [Pseudomonadota bacterium]